MTTTLQACSTIALCSTPLHPSPCCKGLPVPSLCPCVLQRRRAKQVEHMREVDRLLMYRRQLYQAMRVSGRGSSGVALYWHAHKQLCSAAVQLRSCLLGCLGAILGANPLAHISHWYPRNKMAAAV